MTKLEKKIFECVNFEDWQTIVLKHVDLAKEGNIHSTNFLFNRRFGIVKEVKPKDKAKGEQVKINFVYNE